MQYVGKCTVNLGTECQLLPILPAVNKSFYISGKHRRTRWRAGTNEWHIDQLKFHQQKSMHLRHHTVWLTGDVWDVQSVYSRKTGETKQRKRGKQNMTLHPKSNLRSLTGYCHLSSYWSRGGMTWTSATKFYLINPLTRYNLTPLLTRRGQQGDLRWPPGSKVECAAGDRWQRPGLTFTHGSLPLNTP